MITMAWGLGNLELGMETAEAVGRGLEVLGRAYMQVEGHVREGREDEE